MARTLSGIVICFLFVFMRPAAAAVIFSDNFDSGASVLWGNESGAWAASGGVYSAQLPGNNPLTYSSVPFVLTDFVAELDINNLQDGGIWLRSTDNQNGVLLVTGGKSNTGLSLYWHIVQAGNVGPILNEGADVFVSGVSDPHLRVEVIGDTYSVFVDGAETPLTALTTDAFSSGRFALYDRSIQTFDNVVLSDAPVVPEPTSLAIWGMIACGCAAGSLVQRSGRKTASATKPSH